MMTIGSLPEDREYASAIKPARNALRKFDYFSVVIGLSSFLNEPSHKQSNKELLKLPWVAERLILWVLSDSSSMYGRNMFSRDDLRRIIHLAWNDVDRIFGSRKINNLHLFMRQMTLPQAPYQDDLDYGAFARQLLLVRKAEPNSHLRKFLDKMAGMKIDRFMFLAWLIWNVSARSFPSEKMAAFQLMLNQQFSQEEQMIAFSRFAIPLEDLQRKVSSERKITWDEWFQPTLMYKFPCMTFRGRVFSWGKPTLRRYFEQFVGDWLDQEHNQIAKSNWEKIFDCYIGDILKRTGLEVLNEGEIKRKLLIETRVCDYLLIASNCIVLVEVKHKQMAETIPAAEKPQVLISKLSKTVIKGLKQLRNTEIHVENAPDLREMKIYSLVVTSGDLKLGAADILLSEAGQLNGRTHIFSANDLDKLCELARLGKTTFDSFFHDLQQRNNNPISSLSSPSQLLSEEQYRLQYWPSHLRDCFNEFVTEMEMGTNDLLARLSELA